MTIQITLSSNEFNYAGTYNDRSYTSLRVKSSSNGRIYFFTIRDQMKLNTMAKKMQLENGKVFVSFGKEGKLFIGTYIDTDAIEESITEETNEEVVTPEERFMNDEKITNVEFLELLNKYSIELSYSLTKWVTDKLDAVGLGQYTYRSTFKGGFPTELSNFVDDLYDAIKASDTTEETVSEEEITTFTADKSLHGFGQSVWVNDNRNTNNTMTYFNPKGNESITIYIHSNNYDKYWEVERFIYSIMKEHGNNQDFWTILMNELNNKYTNNNIKETKQQKITNKPKLNKPTQQINMSANYAKLLYNANTVDVIFTNDQESHTITFKHRKSWSHRKYVDRAMEQTGINLSYNFRYGWEILKEVI